MRIVSLVPSATEIVCALGLGDFLVGVTHSCDHPPSVTGLPRVTRTSIAEDATSAEIDRAVKESVSTGAPLYDIDVGLLERLSPDLVITQGVCDVCAVGETQALGCLSELSRRTEVLSLHPHRFADVMDDIVRVGRQAGTEEQACELVAVCEERVDRVSDAVSRADAVSVVVLEWIDPPYTCGHWTPEVVEMAGGRELLAAPGDRSRQVDWEEIRDADPEVIVLACCGQDEARTLSDLVVLEARSGWADLRAVREGRVYVADGGAYFSRPGPRLVDAVELLGATLHAEVGSGPRLRRALGIHPRETLRAEA